MITIVTLLLLAAAIITIAHAMNRAPLWPAVLCLILAVALDVARIPIR